MSSNDNRNINIMILAAGLGERLRPITNHIPKPLVPILGRPVLQYVLANMKALPYSRIGINIHHKKEAIERWAALDDSPADIVLFPEESVLGTGGGLKNAEELLKEGTFLVHNGDIVSDMDLRALVKYHRASSNLVTLAVHDYPGFKNVIIDDQGFLLGISTADNGVKKTSFTGVAVYEPAFLELLSRGGSSVITAWLDAVSSGYKVGTFDVSGCCWTDIGTPAAYARVVFYLLRNEGETVYVHRSFNGCTGVDLLGNTVIEENCTLRKNVSLRNCIVLPGTALGGMDKSVLYENCIIGPDFKIDLHESDILCIDEEGRQVIGTGGSDRTFFRVRGENGSAVLMQCREDDREFSRHIEYSRFFLRQDVPVPQLLDVEPEKKEAVFEDAGDISLYSYLKCRRSKAETEEVYKKAIDALIHIHAGPSKNVSEFQCLQDRIFDYDHFRWETDYFIQRFVKGLRNVHPENTGSLEKEFHHLAARADSFPKTIVHRDFQSQNIMIMKGQEIRIIDYQGARIGPPAYDVASLLWDPYTGLEDDIKDLVLDYYIGEIDERFPGKCDEKSFRESLLICRLQRHMQALGAYGYLSSVKGKKYFLKHVPECLRLLKEDLSGSGDEYPALYRLIMSL